MTESNAKLRRIVWDMTFTAHTLTGTRVYAHNVYRALDALGAYDLRELYGGKGGGLRGARNMLWLFAGLERELNALKPDLFHAAAYLGPRRAPCPVIVNVFDVAYLAYPHYFDWKWRAYARLVIPHTVRNAAAVVTLTEHARGEIVNAYLVAPQKVHVVAPGVGPAFQPCQDEIALAALRAKYKLASNYVLHVGETNPRKNIPALIGAVARVRGEFPDMNLVLAGPGIVADKAVTRAIASHDLQSVVLRLGYVPQADLPLLMAGARAFVYASKLEGFGIPPVEAMACGVSVVSAPNPPMPEVLGEAAYFAADDSPDALAYALGIVLRETNVADALREKGLARARTFTWERAADAMREIYAHVFAEKRAKGKQ